MESGAGVTPTTVATVAAPLPPQHLLSYMFVWLCARTMYIWSINRLLHTFTGSGDLKPIADGSHAQ
jgi:hypothetical protein